MSPDYKITRDDCTKILQKHLNTSDFELIAFEEQSVANEVIGIMGGHYKLKTRSKLDGKLVVNSFFVKRVTSPYDIQTKMIKDAGMYDKEYFAYEKLPSLYENQVNYKCDYLAKCYLAVRDNLLLFQDVTECGFQSPKDVLAFLDMDHMKVALKAIAKLHAGSIIFETKQSLLTGHPYCMLDEFSEYFQDTMYRKEDPNFMGTKFYITCFKAIERLIDVAPYFTENRREIKMKFSNAVEQVYELVKPSKKYRNVLCHGDLWNSNILFKYNGNRPEHCILLDFQAIRYTIPAHDFAYFVIFNCGIGTKNNNNYNELVKYYYSSLDYYLKENNIDVNKHISFEEFLETLEYIIPFVIVQNACFSSLCLIRMYDDVRKDQKTVKKFFYENRNDLCVKAYKENEEFRNIMDAALMTLTEL